MPRWVLAMWFSSLVSFTFSRLVFHLLFHLLSLLFSCLSSSLFSLLPLFFLSLLFHLLLSWLVSPLSYSLAFLSCLVFSCLSFCVTFSVTVWCCGRVVVVWCGVSVQNVPVCTCITRTCWNTCARGADIHGDVSSALCFSSGKLVIFEHVEQHLNTMSGSCLIANFLLTKIGPRSYHLLERLTKVSTGSFPFSSLQEGREQHVLDSSNYSPHQFDIQSTASPSLSAVSTLSRSYTLLVKNQKRGVVKVVLEICSTSVKNVICVESRECPVPDFRQNWDNIDYRHINHLTLHTV